MRRNLGSALIVTIMLALAIPAGLAAQKSQLTHSKHHHYQLVQLPTFGGPGSYFFHNGFYDINNVAILSKRGATGDADTHAPDPFAATYPWSTGYVAHTFQWRNGVMTDLGALPGGGSSMSTWESDTGLIAGVSENGETDPLFPGMPEVRAVFWKDGQIQDLGTLPGGGYESEAQAVNGRGQVVGAATNVVSDSNSMANADFWFWYSPYGYQTRAFLWDQESGMQDLGTLGTGTDARATLINDKGQVVGISYTSQAPGACAQFSLAFTTGTFIWDRQGGIRDLGNLGGTCTIPTNLSNKGLVTGFSFLAGDSYNHGFLWESGTLRDLGNTLGGNNTVANSLNENGDSVGFASLEGDASSHAILWKHDGDIVDLGTVGDDPCSTAWAINAHMQVVGFSTPVLSDCGAFDDSRPFLWEGGSMVDLNALVPPGSQLSLVYAYSINDRGEIAGNGFDVSGIERAFVLIPCDENHSALEGCDYSLVDTSLEGAALAIAKPQRQSPRGTTLSSQSRRAASHHISGM